MYHMYAVTRNWSEFAGLLFTYGEDWTKYCLISTSYMFGLEQFLTAYDKTKTNLKVIALKLVKGQRQCNEPIKTQSNYMKLMQSTGKRVSHSWLGFYLWLDEEIGASFFKPIAQHSKCKTDYFLTLEWGPVFFTISYSYIYFVIWVVCVLVTTVFTNEDTLWWLS